jgi:hypothetical protein
MVWKPNVTVAAVLERDGRFLLVEEETEYGVCYNQPAGHLECGESLIDAVSPRNARGDGLYPESAVPDRSLQLSQRGQGRELPAFCLRWRDHGARSRRALDEGILAAHWLTLDEIRERQAQHRSPLVLLCIEDWLAGRRYPLELLHQYTCAA